MARSSTKEPVQIGPETKELEVECGIEHPRLDGNYCIIVGKHDIHEDAAGNEWQGKP